MKADEVDKFVKELMKKLDDIPSTQRTRLLAAMPFSAKQALNYFIDSFGYKDDFASIFSWLKHMELEKASSAPGAREYGSHQNGFSSFQRLDPQIMRFQSTKTPDRQVAKTVTLE